MSAVPCDYRPWAIVPAKSFASAKSRLDRELGPARPRLAGMLLARVLDACRDAGVLDGLVVATDGDDVGRVAAAAGAYVVRDRDRDPARDRDRTRSGLAEIVDHALAASSALGATHGLVLMADLPLLAARDVRELVAQLRRCDFVIAPDADRRGTSALGLHLGLGARTQFGQRDSLQRHAREALRVGARPYIASNPRVSSDLDTRHDLARLRRHLPAALTAHSTR